ncbi:MAG: hypothetical protein GY714_09720 [Desulfobacterales bacterium]|nr:hypothetical protein [Desulfobacterales bacterium]
MGRVDPLITGIHRAVKYSGGSEKTKFNHLKESQQFVKVLRSLKYGVKAWKNVTNKHVQKVVNHWQSEGKAPATIKEYLSGVRAVANFWSDSDKPKISPDNKTFNIENRVYVDNRDKSLPDNTYKEVVSKLKESLDPHHNRVAAQLQLSRELGLRKEESYKFTSKSVLKNGSILITHGTKGGRERTLLNVSDKAKEAIRYTESIAGKNNLIPKHMTEKQWVGKYYRILEKYGVTKKECGASTHGARHAYAHERYVKITGFNPPVKFESKLEFRMSVKNIENWEKLDQEARHILKFELGHGAERNDVVSQYIGSHFVR